MRAAEIYREMKSIVEAPGYKYLQSYKDDFYKHDAHTINNELVDGSRYLWVVGPSGTHLTRIGVHEKAAEWAKVTVSSGMTATNLGVEIYLVTTKGIKKLDEKQALAEIAKPNDYSYANGVVRDRSGAVLASIDVSKKTRPGDGNQYVVAKAQCKDPNELSTSDILALRDIAQYEGSKAWSSLFIDLESFTINDSPLLDFLPETADFHQERPLTQTHS
jgi:hypothetical protein